MGTANLGMRQRRASAALSTLRLQTARLMAKPDVVLAGFDYPQMTCSHMPADVHCTWLCRDVYRTRASSAVTR